MFFTLTVSLFLTQGCDTSPKENNQQQKENVAISNLALIPLRAGRVNPEGWIREQMRLNVEEGLAGSYERIWLNVALELFAKQERKFGYVKIMRGKLYQMKI